MSDASTAGQNNTGASGDQNAAGATGATPGANPNPNPGAAGDGQQTNGQPANGQQTNANGQQGDGKGQPPGEVVYDFKAPEGMELDTALVGEFTPIAKELKLDASQAQKLVDLYGKTRLAEAEALAQTHAQWADQVRNDKEIGGANLDTSLSYAKAAVTALGGDELVKVLNETGLGNHPAVVRAFVNAGKKILPDGLPEGKSTPAGGGDQAALAQMYPSMAKGA